MANEEFAEALTLYEYSQLLAEGSMERAILETFVAESDIMMRLPMIRANNAKYAYPQEEELPTVQHRGYNEDGNISHGKYTVHEEGVFLMDEYIRTDRALVDLYGSRQRVQQVAGKVKAMARHFTRVFINGDNSTEPREPNGLKPRAADGEQTVIDNSAAAGGAALSLGALDEAIHETRSPSAIVVDRGMLPLFQGAARSSTLTNTRFADTTDPLGRKVLNYQGLPLLSGYPKSRDASILPFTEVGAGGGAAQTTSIFVLGLGEEEGVFAIEGTPLQHKDEGQLQGHPVLSDHVKWDFGFVSKEFAITRLTSITDAAIVA